MRRQRAARGEDDDDLMLMAILGGSYIDSIDDDPGEAEEGGELLEQDEQGERLFLRAPRVVRR